MDVILVPGLWLDASSWDDITPALEREGHRARPMTMPGVGAPASESSGIGMSDWVDAVVAEIDRIDGPVALVGHSGGGNVVWAAAGARPDRVSRVVFVDTVPPPEGGSISEFETVDGVVPFPGWDFFGEDEVGDLDAATRERAAARTKSVPARVPSDAVVLGSPARHAIPVTLLSGSMDEAEFREAIGQWGAFAEEFSSIGNAEVVRLGTGHWPQFSDPDGLAEALVASLR